MRGAPGQLNLGVVVLPPIGPGSIMRSGKRHAAKRGQAMNGRLRVQQSKHHERLDMRAAMGHALNCVEGGGWVVVSQRSEALRPV